jgi:PAS domain S-box-containing protein
MEKKSFENVSSFQFQEQFFDAIPAGVTIIDRDFLIQRVNKWVEDKFSFQRPLVGRKCNEVTCGCDHIRAQCPTKNAFLSGQAESETMKLFGDCGIEWAQITSFPIRNENGDIYACIEYIVDVSEKKRNEQLQSVMLEISNAVHNTIDTSDLIGKIRNALSRVIDTSNFFIALYNKEADSLQLPFFADEQDEFDSFPAGKTLTRKVLENNSPLLLHEQDIQKLVNEGQIEQVGSPAKVWLGVPLMHDSEAFGALVVQSYTDEQAFGKTELNILKFVSDQVAIAVIRKQTEEILSHERRLMQALLDNTTDFIFFKDKQGRFIKTSRSHCRYLGQEEPRHVIGKTDFDFYSHDLAQEYQADERFVLHNNSPIIDKEERASLSNRDDEWLATTKIPLVDENQDVIGLFGITRNISMQKRTEQELRQSEVQYRTALNAMQDAIHVVDPKLRIILANTALIQMNESLGLETDVLGRAYFSVYAFLHSSVKDEYDQVFTTGKMLVTESMNSIAGQNIYTETRKIPIYENEKVTQVLTVIRNTTNRHQREEEVARLAAAVEQAGDSIIIMDKSGTIVYVNPMYEKTAGNSKHEIIGRPASVLKSDHYDVGFYEKIWQTIAAGKTWAGHLINRRPDGAEIEQDVTISPIFNSKGEIENFVSVSKDVTNEIKMQKQLVQAQKMEAIGTLAGGIAHDFNNILASIIGFSQLSQIQAEPGSKIEKNLDNILKACDRARELTQQILLYSRGDEQEKHPLQISSIVKEAIKLLKASLPATITLTYNIDRATGFVLGTPTQIHQILMNLATNAAHAMSDGAGSIHITLKSVVSSREGMITDYIQLVVSDTGSGIPKEIQARIFDPFFTTKPTTKGTGLGLSVVHGIVKSMGGEISVSSKPNKGARFEILLPQVDFKHHHKTPAPNNIPGGSECILFVDDEINLVSIGQEILANLGYAVVTCVSSEEALGLFRERPQRFDLVITDQTMPGMPGNILAKEIRALRPDIPIILCTGYSETSLNTGELPASIDRIVLKPFYMDELARLIREVLDAD